MKKLLATLIVAAMLISCMSVIVFADAATFATVTSYPYDGMDADNGKTGSRWALTDTGFSYLYDQYEGNGAVEYYDTYKTLTGYVASAGHYIVVPLNITTNSGIGLVKANVAFDADILEYVNVISAWEGAFTAEPLSAGNVAGGGMLGADTTDTDVTALAFIFKVKDDAVGDSNGEASTTVTFSNAKVVFTGADSEAAGTITTPSLSINLTGLTPGAPATKTDITAATVNAAEVPVFTTDAADITEDETMLAGKTEGINLVKGDGKDIDLSKGYKAAFGDRSYDAATYNAPDHVGVALYDDAGLVGYYEAKCFSADGKFGILFFGLKDGVNYTMKNYVQYDGAEPIVAN